MERLIRELNFTARSLVRSKGFAVDDLAGQQEDAGVMQKAPAGGRGSGH